MSNLIIVKQLPIIEEQLQEISKEIDEKVNKAISLVCNEENKSVVKNLRAELNKEFTELEAQRKEVKQKVLEPYNQFERVYKENISDKYKFADKTLKEKIDTIEEQQKIEKENELKAYFYQCRAEHNIDFVTFENLGLNITLSASMTSLEKKIEDFINRVVSDLELIDTQQNKEEILIEYKKDLNVSRAIKEVMDRKKALLEIEQQKINDNLEKEKKQIENNLQQLAGANTGIDFGIGESQQTAKTYTITFKVTDTSVRLKKLHDFLVEGGYKYE